MTYQIRNYKYDLLTDHDATQDAAPYQTACSSYAWSLVVVPNGLTWSGTEPTVIVKRRNKSSETWKPYKDCAEKPIGDGITFIDSMLPYEDLQLEYNANGATGGTIDAFILLKPLA